VFVIAQLQTISIMVFVMDVTTPVKLVLQQVNTIIASLVIIITIERSWQFHLIITVALVIQVFMMLVLPYALRFVVTDKQ